METLRDQFLAEIRGFLKDFHMRKSRLGQEALSDPTFVWKLEAGRDPGLNTVDRVLAYMREQRKCADSSPP